MTEMVDVPDSDPPLSVAYEPTGPYARENWYVALRMNGDTDDLAFGYTRADAQADLRRHIAACNTALQLLETLPKETPA